MSSVNGCLGDKRQQHHKTTSSLQRAVWFGGLGECRREFLSARMEVVRGSKLIMFLGGLGNTSV